MPETKPTKPTQEEVKTQPESKVEYLHITPDGYLFVSPALNIVLYPGVSAVCTQDQFDSIDSGVKHLLTVKKISQDEFKELFKKQGILGVMKDTYPAN